MASAFEVMAAWTKCQSFTLEFLCDGQGVSGKLSCMGTGLVSSTIMKI